MKKKPTRASSTAQAHEPVVGKAVALSEQAGNPPAVRIEPCTSLPTKDAAHAAHLAKKIDRLEGDIALSPAYNASTAINAFRTDKDRDIATNLLSVADKVARMAEAIRTGDMANVEELLIAQASTLNVIFTTYCLRSAEAEADAEDHKQTHWGELSAFATTQRLAHLDIQNRQARMEARAERLLMLALRAQSCSRATLDTLANVKFPRTNVFAKQANVSHGHQQVNNGAAGAPGDEHGSVLESKGEPRNPEASNSSVGQFSPARARRKAPR